MNIIEKRLDEIQPYENNPRHNDQAVEYVANSLKRFGWKQPIVIDKDGVIVAGHTRWKAAKTLGWHKAPCVIADDLSPEEVKAYRLADNKVGELAEWDFSALELEMTDLDGVIDMADFGFFDEAEEEEADAEDDDYDIEPPEEPKTKLGDIYQLGRHRLMCGDSTILTDVEKLSNGREIDLLLTDPPYNVALGMGGSVDEARKRHRRTDGLVIMNDKMENDDFRKFLTDCFSNAKMVMKPGASFYIWHADNEGYNFRGAVMDAVLDLFGGSGTTMICCEENGRDAYLMELDPRYCDVIVNRWETLTGKKAVLVNGN